MQLHCLQAQEDLIKGMNLEDEDTGGDGYDTMLFQVRIELSQQRFISGQPRDVFIMQQRNVRI